MKHFVGCLVLGLCLSATAPASVIFNNGLPNQASSDFLASTITAEDFFVPAATLLTGFEFWDVEDNANGAYNGSITWLLYTDLAGTPGSIIAQGNASTAGQITRTQNIGVTCCAGLGFNEFDNVVNLAASLTSGSLSVSTGTYWLGLYDGPLANTDFQDFYWETTANNTSAFGQLQDQTISNAGEGASTCWAA